MVKIKNKKDLLMLISE